MNPLSDIVLVIVAITITICIWVIALKFFVYPVFFKPKLDSFETFEFLENRLAFVEKRELTKSEKQYNAFKRDKGISLKRMFSERVEYLVVGYSEIEGAYHFFWLELRQFYLLNLKLVYEFFSGEKIDNRRVLKFKPIMDPSILAYLNKNYSSLVIIIDNKCPACQNIISKEILECPQCGLNLNQ